MLVIQRVLPMHAIYVDVSLIEPFRQRDRQTMLVYFAWPTKVSKSQLCCVVAMPLCNVRIRVSPLDVKTDHSCFKLC